MDVSDMIANVGDIQTTYVRIDLGGVVRKCGSNIEFIGDARQRLLEYYWKNGLVSVCAFAIYAINNDWTYSPYFECPLDFATLKYDSYKAVIGCLDNSIASLIRANNGTVYEMQVKDLKEKSSLKYDGIKIKKTGSHIVTGSPIENYPEGQEIQLGDFDWWLIPPTYVEGDDVESIAFLMSDQKEFHISGGDIYDRDPPPNTCTSSWFIECVKDGIISIDVNAYLINSFESFIVYLYKITPNGTLVELVASSKEPIPTDHWKGFSWSGLLSAGEKLQLAMVIERKYGGTDTIRFKYIKIKSTWNDRKESVSVDVVRPERLLGRLLYFLNGEKDGIYSEIRETLSDSNGVEIPNSRLIRSRLTSAESVRGFSAAKIYASFNDFCQWMEAVFRYIYH